MASYSFLMAAGNSSVAIETHATISASKWMQLSMHSSHNTTAFFFNFKEGNTIISLGKDSICTKVAMQTSHHVAINEEKF